MKIIGSVLIALGIISIILSIIFSWNILIKIRLLYIQGFLKTWYYILLGLILPIVGFILISEGE